MEIHKKILSIFTLFFLLFSQLSVFADEMWGDEWEILSPQEVLWDDVIDSEDSDIKYFFSNDEIYYGKKKSLYASPWLTNNFEFGFSLDYLYYTIPLKNDLNKTLSWVYDFNWNEFVKLNWDTQNNETWYNYDVSTHSIKLWAKSFYNYECKDRYCYDDGGNFIYKYDVSDYTQTPKNITIEFTDWTKTTFPFRFYLPNFTIQNQVSQDGVIIWNNSQDIILNFENIDELHFNSSEYNVNNIDTNFYGNDTVSFSWNSMILHDSIDDSATTDIRVIFWKNFDNFVFNYTVLHERYCDKKDVFLYTIKDNSIYLDWFTNNYIPNTFVWFDFDLYKFANNSFVKIEDNNYIFENSFTKIDAYNMGIAWKLTLNNLNDGIYKIIWKNVESKYSNICSEYFNKDKKSIFYEDTFKKFNLTFIKSWESVSKYVFSFPDIDDIFSESNNTISSIDYNLAKNINITISSYSWDLIKSYSKSNFEKENDQYKVNFNNTEINNYFTSKWEKNKVVKFNYFYEKLDWTSDQREYLYLLKSNIYFPWYNEYTYFWKISLAWLAQYDLYQIIFKSQDWSVIAELNKDDYTQKSLEYGMDYMYLKSDYEKYIKDLLINYYLNTWKEIIVEKNKKMSDWEIVTTTNSIVLQPDFSLSNFDFNPNYLKNITTINNLFNYFEWFSNYKNFNLTFKDQNWSTLKSFSSNDYYLNWGDAIYLKKNYNELFDFFKWLYLGHNNEELSLEVDYTDINWVQDIFTRRFTISDNVSFSNILNEYSLRNIWFSNIDSFDNIYKTATWEIVYSKNNLSPEIFNDWSEYQIYYEIINNLKDYSKNNDFYVDFKSDYIVRKINWEVLTLPLTIEWDISFILNFIDSIWGGWEWEEWWEWEECPPWEKCWNNSLKIVDNIWYSLKWDNYIEFPMNYLDNAGILNIDFITSSWNILSIEKEDFECEWDYCVYYFNPESNPLGNLGDQTLVNMQVYYKDVNWFEDNFVTKFYVINNENLYNIYELGSDIDLSDVFYDYDNLDFNIDKSYYTTSNNFSIKIYDYADNLIRDINKNDFNCDKWTCEYNNQSDLDNLSWNIYHIVINYTDLLGKNYNLDEYINIGDDYSFYLDFTTKIEKDGQKYFYFSPDFESDNIYIEEDWDDKNLRYKYYNWYDASIDIWVKLLHSWVETNLEVDKDIYKVGDLLKFVFNDEKINTDSKIIFYNLNNEDDIFYVINLWEYLDKVDNLNYLSKDNDNKTLSVSHYNIDKPSSNYLFGRKINLSANNDNQYSYWANYVYSLWVNISWTNIWNIDKSKLLVCSNQINWDDDISSCDTLEYIESTQKSFDNFTIYMYWLKWFVDSNFDSIKIDFNFDVLVSYNLG